MDTDSSRSQTLAPGSASTSGTHGRTGHPEHMAGSNRLETVDQAEYVYAKADAQRSATLIQLAALSGALVCICLAALLHAPINRQRQELQLVMQSNLYKELPPKYAWVSAAGGTFRGIAADILWARAEELKQEGKYYELHQLAKWICTLQPRFAAVWSFQAWNMSYNISVGTHTGRERWQWVYNGIRLLRDEGIPNNEKVVPLYHQLAWTWFHKVGDRLDDYHLKYKRRWATTMEVLLGSPPAGASQDEQVNYFKPVAEAPRSLSALYEKAPGTKALVEKLAAIKVDVNVETNPTNIFHPLEETFFKAYTSYSIEKRFSSFRKTQSQPKPEDAALYAFFDAAPTADLNALIAYLRAKVLRDHYKMDPQYMFDLQTELGVDQPLPIDWRNPWSHALYWGTYGTKKGRDLKTVEQFDLINTDRIVLFSLGAIARQGDYVFRPNLENPEESFLDLRPDWRYTEAMHQTALRLGKQYAEKGEDVRNTAGEMFRDYHINTLQSLLLGLYFAGHKEQAQKYYDYLAVNYPDMFTGKMKTIYENFHDFMQQQIKEVAGTQYEASMLIHSLLSAAYMELGNGRHDEYALRSKQAHDLYESYQTDTVTDPEGRRSLPPWEQMQADALGGYVTNPELPLLLRFVVWDRESGIEVKKRCYDDVRRILEETYGKTDLDIDKAFPAPPGMEEWRKSHPVETPEQLSKQAREAQKEKERAQQQ